MEAKAISVMEFFESKKKVFKIPIYQRNYEWTEKECKKLIDDIEFAKKNNLSDYFIGSIVNIYDGISEECLIIDGQQRLTTISLILMVIRYLVEDKKLKREIKVNYLINEFAKKENQRVKLKTIRKDFEAFSKILEESEDLIKDSQITKNFVFIKNRLKILGEEKLKDFYEYLEKICVVEIKLRQGEDDPQSIFESINSTGLGLEESDLVRNFVLMKQKNQEDLYRNYWEVIEKNTSYKVTEFTRDYLTMKQNKTPNKKNVYEEFKKFVLSKKYGDKIEELLNDMKKFSKYYGQIINSEFENKDIKNHLENINMIEVSVSYPFLLEIIDDLNNSIIDENILKEILNYLEVFVIRRFVCDVPTGALNKIFMVLGREIKRHKNYRENYFEVFKSIINRKSATQRMPKDEEFKDKLKIKNIYKLKDKKYLFKKIENHGKRNIVNFEETSFEHIMPQTLTKEWKEELGENYKETHEEYLNVIGNLTLINSGDNGAIKNKPFKDKKKFIKSQSNYTLNNYFKDTEVNKWDKEEIDKRTDFLVKKALEIWKYQNSIFDKEASKEGEGFNFEDIEDYSELQGKKISSYKFLKKEMENVDSWRGLLRSICKELYENNEPLFLSLLETQEIKEISKNKKNLRDSMEVNKHVFVEGHLSTTAVLKLVRKIIEKFQLDKTLLEIELKGDTDFDQ